MSTSVEFPGLIWVKDPVDLQGIWWVPDEPERQRAGVLTWDPAKGATLKLVGRLAAEVWEERTLPDGGKQFFNRLLNVTPRYPVILGDCSGVPVTLLDGLQTELSNVLLGENAHETVHADRAVIGTALFDTEVVADRLTVSIQHLTAFVGRGGIELDWPPSTGPGSAFAQITASYPDEHQIVIGSRPVSLVAHLWVTGDRVHDAAVRQEWRLRCAADADVPLDGLMVTAGDVQDLVTIAIGRPAAYGEIGISRTGFIQQHEDLGPHRADDSKFYAVWTTRTDPGPLVKPHERLFTYDDLGAEEGLGRWLVVAEKYRTQLRRVMATRYSRDMYREDRILNICAALEAFDVVRRNLKQIPTFAKQMDACVSLAGEPFLDLIAQNADAWVTAVKDVRHDIAHHRQPMRDNASGATYGLSVQVYWLFVMCMLREANAPERVWERIAAHPSIGNLKDHLASAT